jgi:hypothetical protein
MSDVVNTQLLQVGSHTYRLRARPIGGKPLQQPQQQHLEDDEEAAAAAAWEEQQGATNAAEAASDDELIDEALISQEGGSFVTRVSVDPQVLRDAISRVCSDSQDMQSYSDICISMATQQGQLCHIMQSIRSCMYTGAQNASMWLPWGCLCYDCKFCCSNC